MSQENVEVAKLGVAAVNETYRSGDLAAWRRHVAATCDPSVVLESKTDAFTEGQWHGHDGVVDFVANQMDVLEEMWLLVDEYIAPGADRLVLAASFGGRARHTGIDMELHPFHVLKLRDGKIIRWEIYTRRSEALEAVGLSE